MFDEHGNEQEVGVNGSHRLLEEHRDRDKRVTEERGELEKNVLDVSMNVNLLFTMKHL